MLDLWRPLLPLQFSKSLQRWPRYSHWVPWSFASNRIPETSQERSFGPRIIRKCHGCVKQYQVEGLSCSQGYACIEIWECYTLLRHEFRSNTLCQIYATSWTCRDAYHSISCPPWYVSFPSLLKVAAIYNMRSWFSWRSRYGGPISQTVTKKFTADWQTYLVTHFKFVVILIDGRGTGNRGKQFESAIHKNLGVVEIQDQMNGLRYSPSVFWLWCRDEVLSYFCSTQGDFEDPQIPEQVSSVCIRLGKCSWDPLFTTGLFIIKYSKYLLCQFFVSPMVDSRLQIC